MPREIAWNVRYALNLAHVGARMILFEGASGNRYSAELLYKVAIDALVDIGAAPETYQPRPYAGWR
jgi:hypothetical protein